MSIEITFYQSAVSTRGQPTAFDRVDSPSELLAVLRGRATDQQAKGSAGYWVASRCTGPHADKNCQPTEVIALDWDDPGPPDWDVLSEYSYVAHTTDSHTPDEPHWRVWMWCLPADAETIRNARCPWPGAHLRSISQPAFVPTMGNAVQWVANYDPDPLDLTEWAFTPVVVDEPFVSPSEVQLPTQRSIESLVTRWLSNPEGTNALAGATGSVLAAWGWRDAQIEAFIRYWMSADVKLTKHVDDALRGAAKRRAGDRIVGLPTLQAAGVTFEPEAPPDDGIDVQAIIAATPRPEADLAAAFGGTWVSGAHINDVVSPPNWLVPRLGLAPGRYSCLSGYGSAGKTWFAQGLAVAVATGAQFCGLDVRQGGVVHVDHEQGVDMTRERYQLLGAPASAALTFISFPSWRLSDPKAGKALLAQLCRGRALCIIDSLRASVAGDENVSEVRQWLDGASEVSDATGCTVLILHHSKKANDQEAIYKARGSSAILDAAGVFWHLELGELDEDSGLREPSILSQTKPGRHPPGGVLRPTPFVVTPQPDGSVQLSLGDQDERTTQARAQAEAMERRVLRVLHDNRLRSSNSVAEAVGGRKTDVLVILNRLKAEGSVVLVNGVLRLTEGLV